MTDFLLELRSEEIPARMQKGARAELEKLFAARMDEAGLKAGSLTVWSTPRRLALIARGLPDETQAVSEERKGPRADAPEKALEGFLRSTGLTKDQLEIRDVKGKDTYFAVIEKPGRATREVMAEVVPAIIRAFSWPKSMRWGEASLSSESLRWVRPLSGIVALFGDELVECEVHGVTSGWVTLGHRFHHHGDLTIGSAEDYQEKLRACHVIVDHEERERLIRDGAKAAADAAGLTLVADEGLVVENAGLTEYPVPLLGRFDEAFLAVPPEVIQLTARINQKYFVCEDSAGKLANAFVCTANIDAADGGTAIVAGNQKVLAARLSDAKFFWELDQQKSLEDHAKGLERITFHEKLGTVADKVERVAKLARWLCVEKIVDGDPDLAEQAARLCKADLVTEMVGEFPELQGLMGGYYAEKEGLDRQVANAIRDHYKPVGQGDEVPTAPVTVAVSLADKLDTIFQFFRIHEKPTGSKDPFALRRAVLGAIRLSKENDLRWSIILVGSRALFSTIFEENYSAKTEPFVEMVEAMTPLVTAENAKPMLQAFGAVLKGMPRVDQPDPKVLENIIIVAAEVRDFFLDRLEVICRDDGIPSDLIRASTIIDGNRGKEDDLVRLLARVKALQAFVETDAGNDLLAAYKRAGNILKQAGIETDCHPGSRQVADSGSRADSNYEKNEDWMLKQVQHDGRDIKTPADEPAASQALAASLESAAPEARTAVEAENFEGAMTALASLREPIDGFFENVMVNDEDAARRAYRLSLLARFVGAVHEVADFSKIEG